MITNRLLNKPINPLWKICVKDLMLFSFILFIGIIDYTFVSNPIYMEYYVEIMNSYNHLIDVKWCNIEQNRKPSTNIFLTYIDKLEKHTNPQYEQYTTASYIQKVLQVTDCISNTMIYNDDLSNFIIQLDNYKLDNYNLDNEDIFTRDAIKSSTSLVPLLLPLYIKEDNPVKLLPDETALELYNSPGGVEIYNNIYNATMQLLPKYKTVNDIQDAISILDKYSKMDDNTFIDLFKISKNQNGNPNIADIDITPVKKLSIKNTQFHFIQITRDILIDTFDFAFQSSKYLNEQYGHINAVDPLNKYVWMGKVFLKTKRRELEDIQRNIYRNSEDFIDHLKKMNEDIFAFFSWVTWLIPLNSIAIGSIIYYIRRMRGLSKPYQLYSPPLNKQIVLRKSRRKR